MAKNFYMSIALKWIVFAYVFALKPRKSADLNDLAIKFASCAYSV